MKKQETCPPTLGERISSMGLMSKSNNTPNAGNATKTAESQGHDRANQSSYPRVKFGRQPAPPPPTQSTPDVVNLPDGPSVQTKRYSTRSHGPAVNHGANGTKALRRSNDHLRSSGGFEAGSRASNPAHVVTSTRSSHPSHVNAARPPRSGLGVNPVPTFYESRFSRIPVVHQQSGGSPCPAPERGDPQLPPPPPGPRVSVKRMAAKLQSSRQLPVTPGADCADRSHALLTTEPSGPQCSVAADSALQKPANLNNNKLTAWGTARVPTIDKMNQENLDKHTEMIFVSPEEKMASIEKWIKQVNKNMGMDLSKIQEKSEKFRSILSDHSDPLGDGLTGLRVSDHPRGYYGHKNAPTK